MRLESTDLCGLDLPKINIPYIVQYKGALIGKHFKALTQTAVFNIHGMCSAELFTLVKATGELSAVVWFHTIEHMSQYLVSAKYTLLCPLNTARMTSRY